MTKITQVFDTGLEFLYVYVSPFFDSIHRAAIGLVWETSCRFDHVGDDSSHLNCLVPLSCNEPFKYQPVSQHSFPSLAALGNQLALLAVVGVLAYAFVDQLYFGELPCPLCLMQRIGFVIIGFALVLNIRCGAHSAHYGWGILGGLVGMMVSLRQVFLHILPEDKRFSGYGGTLLVTIRTV